MAKKEEEKVIDTKVTKKEKNNKSSKKEKKNSFKNLKTELKKVTWPTPKELVNKTISVIVFVLIIAIIVFIFDVIFENVYNFSTSKLKNIVASDVEDTVGDTAGILEEQDAAVEDTTSQE